MLTNESWPTYTSKDVLQKNVIFTVQVNGKLRGTIELPAGTAQVTAVEGSMKIVNVQKFLTTEPKKVIFVKDRLINFVV